MLILVVIIIRQKYQTEEGRMVKIFDFMKDKERGDENLIQEENKKSREIFKNRLFLTSVLNAIIFLVFVFSMAFYRWGKITIVLDQTSYQADGSNSKEVWIFYFNLLYAKMPSQSHYQSFSTVQSQICATSDFYCNQIMSSLQFVGYLSFSILAVGALFQIYDLVRMLLFLYRQKHIQACRQFQEEKQDNLRHVGTIGLFLIGLTLDIFGVAYIDASCSYGPSFWIFVVGLICFIVIIAYEQFSYNKLQQQKLILDLIQGQKKIAQQMNMNIQMSVDGDHYI